MVSGRVCADLCHRHRGRTGADCYDVFCCVTGLAWGPVFLACQILLAKARQAFASCYCGLIANKCIRCCFRRRVPCPLHSDSIGTFTLNMHTCMAEHTQTNTHDAYEISEQGTICQDSFAAFHRFELFHGRTDVRVPREIRTQLSTGIS